MEFELRPLQMDDIDDLVKYANNLNISGNLTNKFPHPYTEEHARHFIQFANSKDPVNVMGIIIDSHLSGAIGIHPQDDIFCKNAEMGYWLAEPFWGKGIITKAIKLMILYGFENWDIDRIFARPFGRNIGSQRALEKAGFILEAKFEKTIFKNDQYEDEWVYAVRRDQY